MILILTMRFMSHLAQSKCSWRSWITVQSGTRAWANCFIYDTLNADTARYQNLHFLAQKITLHKFTSSPIRYITQDEDTERRWKTVLKFGIYRPVSVKDIKRRIRNVKKEIKNAMTKATEAHTIQNDSFSCWFLPAQNSHTTGRRRVYNGNDKGKVHPRTDNKGPEGEYRYSSTLSLTSTLDGVAGQHHGPAALTPGKRPGTSCTGGCVVWRDVGKLVLPGFDTRTVHSIASRYTG